MDAATDQSSNHERPKAPSVRDVEARRDIITKLYWDDDHNLPEVMKIMKEEYGFNAT
jgi:hypothetical protein